MKTVEIVIDANGEIELETKGFKGRDCKAASKPYEDALGVVGTDRPTAEAHLVADVKVKQ